VTAKWTVSDRHAVGTLLRGAPRVNTARPASFASD
jgi:hypothetical protein